MKVLSFLKPYTISLILLIMATVGQVAANLELPDYTAEIINKGVIAGDQGLIVLTGLKMLGVALLGGICTVIAGYIASKVGTGFSREIRSAIFTKVENFSLSEINRFSTSSLITRSTNDAQQLQMVVVMILRMVLSAPITAVWAVFKAVQIAPNMSWIMGLAVISLLGIIAVLLFLAIPKFQLLQKLTDKLNLIARENLKGIRVIRAFNNEKIEYKRLMSVNTDLTNTNLFIARLVGLMQPIMFLIMNLASVGIVWIGSHLIVENKLGIGDMMAFMQYAIQVIISFLLISIVFIMVPRAMVSAKRIMEVLQVEPSIKDPDSLTPTKVKSGRIEFKEVTFGYSKADTPVLENISFTASPGEITALIGSTGSGKSTLVNLIPRFYDVMFGEILLDGINIKDLSQADLRSHIGYVSQKPVIFSGTIESNIRYGVPKANITSIIKAAKTAQAAEFIDKLPKKYQTPISQSGTNMSGGQKQRISIARAIVKDPDIYIFDDSFSALDYRTEARLRQSLREEVKDKTVIVVAQRVNSVIYSDQIIVLDQGKIVGIGKHQDLIKTCQVYQEIARSQLSETELDKYLHN